MTATAAQISTLRRMTDEPTIATYSDVQMQAFIEACPLVDELGTIPYSWDLSTDPPTKISTPQWIPTYDLNKAAGEVWGEKAAAVAESFTFSADGGDYDLNAKHTQYMKMASMYRSKRAMRQVPMTRGI
jgi:hypothetical protein